MYLLLENIPSLPPKIVQRLTDKSCIPFDPDNTDYQQFKIDLANGAELHDANNNVMTSDQVTSFLATSP
jgi:hypothetical protein